MAARCGYDWDTEAPRVAEALKSGESLSSVARRYGVGRSTLYDVLVARGLGRASDLKPRPSPVLPCSPPGRLAAEPQTEPAPRDGATLPREVQRLVDAIRTAPRGFRDLCDRLDLSPRKCEALIERAEDLGIDVARAHDHVGFDRAPDNEIQRVGVDPVVGETQRVAVLSDTHYGSRYCLRDQIREFVGYAYERGCRQVLCPGDMVDGCYDHGVFELTHSGLDSQADDAAENLPAFDGLSYHWITGNHDFTFAKRSGLNVGDYIEQCFRRRGRSDVNFYGDHGAYLQIAGAVVHLWHPKGSANTYALSYPLQKQLERYSRTKPSILLAGHWHRYTWVEQRGVHAIACPCFQGGQSAFGRSLGGNPTLGGLILSWQRTATGTIRRFAVERCTYYEDEKIVEPRNRLDGKIIPPTVSRPVAVPDTRWESCS